MRIFQKNQLLKDFQLSNWEGSFMKHIEYYESNDGTKFNDKIDCIEYELINSYHNTKGLVIKDFEGNTINNIYILRNLKIHRIYFYYFFISITETTNCIIYCHSHRLTKLHPRYFFKCN